LKLKKIKSYLPVISGSLRARLKKKKRWRITDAALSKENKEQEE
jgi:hypothetical protein